MLEFLGYEELIDSFYFREEGAIKIPKSVREAAYTLQIDLEIVSTLSDGYKNYKSSPAFGFYGYAVLVLRDFTEVQIAIEQPRQTLYYDRLESAYVNWYALYLAYVNSANIAATQTNLLVPIGAAVGVAFTPTPADCLSNPVFVELPIREVYVECAFGTTFRLEISHWKPIPVVYGDCEYDGKSGQEDDPIKDDGLPELGVQPQISPNPESPYLGFPVPSAAVELGEFLNNKLDGLDSSNADNAPSTIGYQIFLGASYIARFEMDGTPVLLGENNQPVPSPFNGCIFGEFTAEFVRNESTNRGNAIEYIFKNNGVFLGTFIFLDSPSYFLQACT